MCKITINISSLYLNQKRILYSHKVKNLKGKKTHNWWKYTFFSNPAISGTGGVNKTANIGVDHAVVGYYEEKYKNTKLNLNESLFEVSH